MARAKHAPRELSRRLYRLLLYALATAGVVVMIGPFLWSISTSLKQPAEVFAGSALPFPPDLWAYREVLAKINFGRYAFNSFKVAALITLGQLLTCSLAGYAFARIPFPGRNVIFVLFLATMMVPSAVTLIPNFVLMRTLGLVDTHAGLVLPFLGSAFGTFLMRQFFLTFPSELQDAAELDGCNPLRFYLHILLPNARPVMATLGLLTFQSFWNEFQWSLIMINAEPKRTLQVGLSYLLNENFVNWPLLMAASVLTNIPILMLFLLAQKQFIQSVKLSGMKG